VGFDNNNVKPSKSSTSALVSVHLLVNRLDNPYSLFLRTFNVSSVIGFILLEKFWNSVQISYRNLLVTFGYIFLSYCNAE
jgi:hypothetical protein